MGSEDILMYNAGCPSNYFFQHFYIIRLSRLKTFRSNLCSNFVSNTPDLNTVESTFKVEQARYISVLVTVNYCRCKIGIPA